MRRCLLRAGFLAGLLVLALAGTALASNAATYQATETIPVPPASTYAGSGGGDGWAVALSSDSVYNVFHHNDILQVACHRQSDASPCWDPETITDAVGDNFATSGQPGLWLDQGTGRLYVYATRASDGTGGVVCIDTTQAASNPDPFCGFTALTAIGDAPIGGYDISQISDSVMVGSNWYAFNYVSGSGVSGTQNKLLCFDTETLAPCASQPFTVPVDAGPVADNDFPPPALAAIGDRVIVPIDANGTNELACFDASAESGCAGSWPVPLTISYDSNYGAPFPLLTSAGSITGLCLPTGQDPCFDLTGAAVDTPAGMSDAIPATSGWNGPALTLGPRVYVPNGNNDQVDCYDYSAQASCANFPYTPSNLGLLYTVNADPQRPSCIWVNADDGSEQIQNFDAYGAGGCGQGPVRVLASTLVAPSSQCVPYSYSKLQVLEPTPDEYANGTVQFEDGDGNPIQGTSTQALDNTGSTDLSGLNLNTDTGLPQFLITLNGTSGTPSSVTVQLTWTGVYDPSCVQSTLTVQPPNNPTLTPGVQQPTNPTLTGVTVAGQGTPGGVAGGPVPTPSSGGSFLSRHWKVIEIASFTGLAAADTLDCGGLFAADGVTVGLTTAAAVAVCSWDADTLAGVGDAVIDPPDSRYAKVYKPAVVRVPALTTSCPHLSSSSCTQVHGLVAAYERAAARYAAVSEAVAVTINRHSGAVRANNRKAALAQTKAESRYLPMQLAAERARQAAGRRLGRWLILHHLNRVISAGALARARAQVISLRGVSAQTIASLEQLGVISSRRELSQLLAAKLGEAPPRATTFAQLLAS